MSTDGSGFRVDSFHGIPPDVKVVFLTHFHADHYNGIEDALGRRGDVTVFCTEITRTLVLAKFHVPHEQVQPLQMCEPRLITPPTAGECASFTVTPLPANHCPGSAALLFEFSNGARWLHTGDFRYTEEMQSVPAWKRAAGVDKLFLDTTFCDKRTFANFPLKSEAQEQVIGLIQKHIEHGKRISEKSVNVYLRCQSLGTEEVFLKIKERLGMRTRVSTTLYTTLVKIDPRFKDVVCNEEDNGVETESTNCAIHACNEFPQKRGPHSLYIRVSAQWSQFSAWSNSAKPKLLDGTWNVLYSGHSSWNELRDFVSFVQPKSIEPLIACDTSSFCLLKSSLSEGECLSPPPPPPKKRRAGDAGTDEQAQLYDDVMKLLDEYNTK